MQPTWHDEIQLFVVFYGMLSTTAGRCLFVLTHPSSLRLSSFPVNHCVAKLKFHPFPISVTSIRDLSTFPTLRMSENQGGAAPEGDQPVKTAKQLKKEALKKEKTEKFLAKQQAAKVAKGHIPNFGTKH